MAPRADVLIPTFNDPAEHLLAAVRTSLACADVARVIVVDDGSDTPAARRLGPLLAGSDADRVVLHRQDNQGVSRARNAGLDLARAPYVVLLDADDELLPGVSDAIDLAERTGAALVVAARINFDDRGTEELKPVPPEWADGPVDHPSDVFRPLVLFSTPGTVVRTDVVRRGVRFDPEVRCMADRDFFRRVGDHGPVCVCSTPTSRYRQHPDGSNMSGRRQLDARVDDHLLVLGRAYEPVADRHWRDATRWLLNQYARHGSDPRRWRALLDACARHGWRAPLKARLRRFRRRLTPAVTGP